MRYEEFTIEGRNAVIEAFRSGKTIDKLFVLDGCHDGPVNTITREARKGDTIINYVSKERLDAMDGEKRSQSRRSIIDGILEPLTATQRKPYNHMRLEDMSEDDFSALQETIKGEVEDIVNEQNARGTVFGRPAQLGKQPQNGKASEKEVEDVVKTMHI